MRAWFAGSRFRGACGVRPDDGGLVARLEVAARLLLKYPALTRSSGASRWRPPSRLGRSASKSPVNCLYKRLPFPEGGRVVRLETQDTAADHAWSRGCSTISRDPGRSLKTGVVELRAARVSERNVLTGEGRAESLRVAEITASAFPLTRVPPLLGLLAPADGRNAGAEPVVVLGYAMCGRQIFHHRAIVGRVVTVGRTARTVVGVMPPRFGFPRNQAVMGAIAGPGRAAAAGTGQSVQVFGRLARRSELAGRRFGAPTSPRHALRPTDQPGQTYYSCVLGCAHLPGARRVIRCGWKIWWSTPSSCCCWGRCRRTSRR